MRRELEELALALKDAFNISTFIETGTWKAQTTKWASENFQKVYSIEIDEGYHNRAKGLGIKAEFILGSSADELPKVVKRLKKPAIFWLDAHACKDQHTLTDPCPLITELAAIKKSGLKHLLLIDDAKYFIERHPIDPLQWPSLEEVKAALPDGYEVVIWQAAIVAMPAEAMPVVRRFVDPQKLEVTVLTSNDYLRCLPPFAYLFNKFWSNQQPVKVVRYEIRPNNLPANFSNYAIGQQSDYTWSSGLIKYLQYHNGELILLMLEDYFIDSRVNVELIQKAWDRMQKSASILKIDLTNDRLKAPHLPVSELNSFANLGVIKSTPDAPFQTSLQAAIWRKDFLLKFLNPKENPWQFEKTGTKRVIRAREAGEFDGLILGFKNPPLSYVNAVGGEGQNPGEWDRKKIGPGLWGELSGRGLV
jgi:hypothetical protein